MLLGEDEAAQWRLLIAGIKHRSGPSPTLT